MMMFFAAHAQITIGYVDADGRLCKPIMAGDVQYNYNNAVAQKQTLASSASSDRSQAGAAEKNAQQLTL